ncbi:MAG: ATP12 family protein [Pseudomonadota bacterium]
MKRFWKEVTVAEVDGGWQVFLDGRSVRTPAKLDCTVPRRSMADRIRAEWDATEGEVQPLEMPMTRTAATCLDRVAPDATAVRQSLVAYGETDLLCYRAPHPVELAERQRLAWDPVLAWARSDLGSHLVLTEGVMHVRQSTDAIDALASFVEETDAWTLTCLADLVTISGSLVLGLAVLRGFLTADDAWSRSRIDEDWNTEEWGDDAEAAAHAARRQADFLHAADVLRLLAAD